MNATPAHLQPAQSASTQSTGAKPQQTADTPFSQVLSSEMAQNGNRSEAAAGRASSTQKSSEPAERSAEPTAPTADAAAGTASVAEDKRDPATLLALPITPDLLNLGRASVAEAGEAAGDAARPGKRKSAAQSLLPVQAEDKDRSLPKLDLAVPGKATPASTQAASAATFASQLADARQGPALNSESALSELGSNPSARPTLSAPLESSAAPSDLAAPRLAPAVGSSAWSQALGEKVVWMATAAQQTATLTLNPPNLGPLQVVVNISNEQATASFFSAQPEVRQALEAAFPKLKEMMNDAGIQLGQATVSADTPRQDDSAQREAQSVRPGWMGRDDGASDLPVQAPLPRATRGLVDTFA